MKTQEPARCLRPDCRWAPLPTINDAGGLEVSPYCSTACRVFCIAAYYVSHATPTEDAKRELQRLELVNSMLDLRDHACQYDEGLSSMEELKAVFGA
ncbi:hypothetical protein [Streptomyces sp. bgisy153]|uniref:hypothetical protein n=1 Tax=Streptomyces sp. bgisy153 TaxID=3413793 RepID=UPI003D726E28